ncbi:MAG: hypothetical protein VX822_03905 [Candidatus Neomarinimicrobiota bacterium]|nr:hypothetical protein [Candidatus Neomarinimicrobiota bacterium]
MTHLDTIGQLALFPELSDSPELPSISTLPEFDQALHNLIKMSDLGAFISVTVHGLNKSYSVHVRELEIPEDFLLESRSDAVSKQFALFPEPLRQQLRKLSYNVKGFFNRENSFRTSFGYFLYRPYFRIWSKFVQDHQARLEGFLTDTLSGRAYGNCFQEAFEKGYRFLESIRDDTAPWDFMDKTRLAGIHESRNTVKSQKLTLHSINKTTADYPLMAIVLKTMHFPTDLSAFVKQVKIQFDFKSIHLDYLKDVDIATVDDVIKMSESISN